MKLIRLPQPEWQGENVDEPEGARYCTISETLWNLIAEYVAQLEDERDELIRLARECAVARRRYLGFGPSTKLELLLKSLEGE